jgi:hypothetical protein
LEAQQAQPEPVTYLMDVLEEVRADGFASALLQAATGRTRRWTATRMRPGGAMDIRVLLDSV